MAAWGSYLGEACGLLLGPPARALWASGKALLELLLPIWQVVVMQETLPFACLP